MSKVPMLTTVDNPYNPFTQFREWLSYDEGMGYHTCSYLARIANTSMSSPSFLGEEIYQEDIENAIDEIIKIDFTGIYKKVVA